MFNGLVCPNTLTGDRERREEVEVGLTGVMKEFEDRTRTEYQKRER